ncbi:hypothetical protein Bca4012_046813 [Brassica carinata]
MSDEETKPFLKSRMYESRYPSRGDIVMGKVKKIEGREAVVWLVEYKKSCKVVLSATVPPVRVLAEKRMEAFRVADVSVEERQIILDETPLSKAEMWAFEKRFNEAKFVHSVLFSVADDLHMNLKDAYKLCDWPSYEELKTLHRDENFLACKNVSFRKLLLDRIGLMKYNSWRVNDPSRLQTSSLKQIRDICYAIALARQAEAFFKKRGDLGKEEHLSIQHILNKGVDYGLVSRDYTLLELGTLVKILQRDGFILDTDCPLTCSLAGTPSASDNSCSTKDPIRVFEAPQIKVMTAGEEVPEEWMVEEMLAELDGGPLTFSLPMFPSYKTKSKKLDDIYKPTEDEFAAYKLAKDKGKPCKLDFHTMLLTGDGIDRYGDQYLECQDCLGDIDIGDRGYVRFAVKPNTVTEFVSFKNVCNHDDD